MIRQRVRETIKISLQVFFSFWGRLSLIEKKGRGVKSAYILIQEYGSWNWLKTLSAKSSVIKKERPVGKFNAKAPRQNRII